MKNLIVVLIVSFTMHLSATIINIPADQPTIQEGINVSVNGDTVLVHPGTFFEYINFYGKNITVASLFITSHDTTYISETVIDGYNFTSCVTFENEENSTATLCGFTIQNGRGRGSFSYWCGGGITINNASPTILNCIISDNSNDIRGGGGAIWNNSNPLFRDCIILNNSDWGIYVNNSETIFINTLIINNEYGLRCYSSDVLIMNCNIVNNSGIGIKCLDNSNPILVNSIVWNNDTNITFFYGYNPNSITISNSDIQGGESAIETNDNGIINWLNSNIDEDPLFINSFENNFHLMDNSLCIGTGINQIEINENMYYAPDFDIENNPRPNPSESMPDMGAYENQFGEPQVSSENMELQIPDFGLSNSPNPFNPTTTISFSIQYGSNVELSIFNIKGQKVQTLINADLQRGKHSIIWSGLDENNKPVSSGIYLYKIKAGNQESVKRMILLK